MDYAKLLGNKKFH